jgi:hypothetical protein
MAACDVVFVTAFLKLVIWLQNHVRKDANSMSFFVKELKWHKN